MPSASTSPYDFSGLNPRTRLALATMAVKEGGDSPQDMQAVLEVAANRARLSGQTLDEVLNTAGAFTSLGPLGTPSTPAGRRALDQAFYVMDHPDLNLGVDPNVDYFYNPTLLAKKHAEDPQHYPASPSFLKTPGMKPAGSYGHQLFYAGPYGGGKQMATGPTASPTVNTAIDSMPLGTPPQMSPEDQQRAEAYRAKAAEQEPAVVVNIEKQGALYQQEIDAIRNWQSKANESYDRYTATAQRLIDSLPDEHKMQMEELSKVSDQPNDPTRVFGQLLPVLAMVGGAFTKAGATGALNAAASAMTAARTHDEDAVKRANTMFHDKLQETMEAASLAHEMLGNELAKAQGNTQAVLQAGQLVGAQLGIPALVQASYNGQADQIWATYATQAKTYADLQAANMKGLKYQEEITKYQQALSVLQSGHDLTDAEVWALGVGINQGMPIPPQGMASSELRNRITKAAADARLNPTWDGPWGVGPEPTNWETEHGRPGNAPAPAAAGTPEPAAGGQPAPAGAAPAGAPGAPPAAAGTAAPPAVSPTQAAQNAVSVYETIKADKASLQNITKIADASEAFERTAMSNFDNALRLAPKGIKTNMGPLIERFIQQGESALGDPNIPAYQAALLTAANEYAKVIAGSTGAQGSTVDTRREAAQMFSSFYTTDQITNVIAVAKQDMDNKIASYGQQRDAIQARLRNETTTGSQAAPPPNAPGAPAHPQGLKTEQERQDWISVEKSFIEAKKNGTLHDDYGSPKQIADKFREFFPNATDAAIQRAVQTIESAR